jgi:hypothetical protein
VQSGLSIIENAKVTKITPGYSADMTTSNGKPRSAPDTGVVKDAVGPHDVDRTANYSYTTRQTFAVKQGDNVYPLTTVVRNQIVVVNGVISSVKTTIVTP